MADVFTVPFAELSTSDLFIDAIYEGGTAGNTSDEVLSKLLHVGNSGGFRKCSKKLNGKRTDTPAYVCVYSSGSELEWRDELDRTIGRYVYWGDNRTAGNPILNTKATGNIFLTDIFSALACDKRKEIPPIFIFQKYAGRSMQFLGLAVPGDRRMNPQEALITVWAQNDEGRYQNYKAFFTILDIAQIDRRWLDDLENGIGYGSKYAPLCWKKWVDKGTYYPLISEKNPVQIRTPNEQKPRLGTIEQKMLQRIIDYFSDPYEFELCAIKIAQIMDSNIVAIEHTRNVKDGGRDAVGIYRIGNKEGGIEVEFALEAKRYQINSPVGVKETSRLISRLKNRQFGIFITTSYIDSQAYKEIVEDKHPVIIVAGRDVVEILIKAGINTLELLEDWLDSNFNTNPKNAANSAQSNLTAISYDSQVEDTYLKAASIQENYG